MNEIIINLEGKEYQIDIQKAKELGVIKEKDQRCKFWEELCAKYSSGHSYISHNYWQITSHESKFIQEFSKLLNLRRDWIEDWNPDWHSSEPKYCIINMDGKLQVSSFRTSYHIFSFPTDKIFPFPRRISGILPISNTISMASSNSPL